MAQPVDVVLAGTKPFALALFAPLTERFGTRPRIAPEPQQALTLCAGSTGLLVVEYGAAWLEALVALRRQAPGLRVVAALPRGEEAAALKLTPLGIDALPWEGQPGPVLAAAERLVARAPSAAGAPAAPRLATTPAAGTPAQPPPPRPPPVAPAAARPPATTPPAGVAARDVPRPAPAALAPPVPAVPAVAAPSPASLEEDLFAGLEAAVQVEEAAPAVAAPAPEVPAEPERAAPPPYTGPPSGAAASRASVDWPATAPSEDEAESALVLYTRGKLRADAPLAAVTRQAVAAMSELERQVVGGAAQPFDTQPIYRAAVLRLRVAAAVAAAPEPPARVDDEAVQRLLAELDAVLSLVNPLAQGAPPEHQPALEAVRNALVREAVDFSEVTHRITAGGPPPPPEATLRSAPRAPAQARVLSVQAGEAEATPAERRRLGPLITLVVLLLAIAGVLGWQQLSRPPQRPPPTFQGAPANTVAVESGPHRLLVATPGKQVDPAELERFKRQEAQKGNVVTEVAPGTWLIEPAPAADKEGTP